jgi:hypothetical protein
MTIKQQGGIFGRNPTFNDVTIEGQLTFDGDIDVNSDLKVDGNLDVTGTGDFGGKVKVTQAGNGEIEIERTSGALINLQAQSARGVIGTNSNHELQLKSNNTGRLKITTAGNVEVMSGNLVISTSGKGIDFSATSGTGTSELFSDYEEGLWSPTITTDATGFDSVTYDSLNGGKYIKVGKMVHVQLFFRTDAITVGSASGSIVLGGLPFANSTAVGAGGDARVSLSVGYALTWGGDVPSSAYILEGESQIRLYYRSTVNGNTLATNVADVGTGTNANAIVIGGTYFAA